jgi:hypothetical protein
MQRLCPAARSAALSVELFHGPDKLTDAITTPFAPIGPTAFRKGSTESPNLASFNPALADAAQRPRGISHISIGPDDFDGELG